ncbi:sulfurtransferase TusA family protein [Lentibacter sp. XHP0401]|jgi:tRNA 2-thiouridine synthesizing protein A|uniref:sulfurtransferase TusA family protein n=1 Tax=Lentibacter sp. XHP0401 TaxID=2984334 RepID=UPI0021E7AE87|nr:sulfurtransferase TusA family protein [Lentibacter sp. XHP0401]MCV2892199.1 sulfurtransferase TusA family protein [Lentibacter sp. XHP0401]
MSEIVDARGLLCPLPVLRLRKRMQALSSGSEITLIADDPAAVIDVPHFCAEAGHSLVSTKDEKGAQHYTLRKA